MRTNVDGSDVTSPKRKGNEWYSGPLVFISGAALAGSGQQWVGAICMLAGTAVVVVGIVRRRR